MPLIVVETVGKQRHVESLLRKLTLDWPVVSCGGHYCGFPKNQLGIDSKSLELVWKVRNIQSFERIKKAVSIADVVYAATDLSPEGEAIANQIRITADYGSKPFFRLCLPSLDIPSLQEALASPRSVDMNLLQSYLTREVVDRLVQFVLAPAVASRLGESGGFHRISLLLLSEIARVERKIRRFRPSSNTVVRVLLSDGSTAESLSVSSAVADEIVHRAKAALPAFSTGRELDPAPPPFTLSALLQFASRRYGLDALACLQACEALYVQGLITYPYTDSSTLFSRTAQEVHDFVLTRLSATKTAPRPVAFSDSASTLEAIRPVQISLMPSAASLSGDAKLLYSAIWFRTVASQGNPAQIERHFCSYQLDDDREIFSASGSSFTEYGWHDLSGKLFAPAVRPLSANATVVEATVVERPTYPPKRHTHGTLLEWLDSTFQVKPWTYKQALESLHENAYTELLGGGLLKITDKGEAVLTFIHRNLPDLLSVSFCSSIEKELSDIELGKSSFEDVMRKHLEWASNAASSISKKSLRPTFNSPTGKKLRVFLDKDSGKPYTKAKGEDWWSYISFDEKGRITLVPHE